MNLRNIGIKLIIIIVFLISIGKVGAAELTTSFSGYYWDRKGDNYHGSGSFRYYYLDGIDSYCLDPDSHEGGPLTLGDWDSTEIPNSISERISLIAYYGYNYQNHQTLEYRAATQAMIWETVKGGNTKVTFFTQRFGEGNELDVSKEKKEIERLISKHKVKPSFDSKEFSVLVGEQLVLNDSNGVISNYNINYDSNSYLVDDNKLLIVPNSNGKINIKMRKKETYTSSYKIFVSDIYQDQIIPGIVDNIESNFIINAEYGKVNIQKKDSEIGIKQGEATLKGAEYGIYRLDNDIFMGTIITDDNGYAESNAILSYGNYYLRELKSSMGYNLDSNKYYFDINSNSKNVHVDVFEDVIKGKIKITKQDSETNTCKPLGEGILSGAKYQIININNNVVDTVIINDDCLGYSKELPYGKYKVKEIEAPRGYKLDNNIYDIFINNDNVEINVVSKEDIIKNRISILKQYDYVEGNTKFVNAEENITFEIFDSNNLIYDTIVTDKNGYALIDLPYGTWKFHQKNVISGYQKINDFYVTVDDNSHSEQYYNILNNKISSYLKLVKKDSKTGNVIKLSGAKFKILNIDTNEYVSQYVGGKLLDIFETDENGIMTTYLKLEAGNYKVIEMEAPNGYLLNNDGITFSINDDTNFEYTSYGPFVTIEYMNEPIMGQLEIKKDGEIFNINNDNYYYDKMPLSSVRFNIYASDDITSPDGTIIYYKKGTLVDKLITDENGYAVSKKLPLGKYYLVETKTDNKYILNKEKCYFELKAQDAMIPIVLEQYSMTNYLKNGNLEIIKKDADSGKVIPNTKIDIYTENNEIIYHGKTDENGKIILNKLPIGKYYIIETEASEGYKINSEKVYFEIKRNNQNVKLTLKNEMIKSKVIIHKIDENNNSLDGVHINIYDDSDKLIYKGITNKDGKIEVELSYGKYYYKEISTIDGYIINDEKVYFNIINDNEILEFDFVNIKKEIEVPNTEANKKKNLLPNTIILLGIILNIYGKKKIFI